MKKAFNSRKQQLQNDALYLLWFERLHDICLSFTRWEDTPFPEEIENDVIRYLNELLFQGHVVGFGLKDGYMPVLGQAVPGSGITWFGGHDTYTITTETGDIMSAARPDLALCYPTPSHSWTLYQLAAHYAMLLTQAEQSIKVNMINQNTPAIIQAPPGQELTYSNMFEQVAGFKPVVYGREGLLDSKNSDLLAYRYLQPAVYVSDKLEMLKHDIFNDFYNALGITAKSIEKKAQLISDELNIDAMANSLTKNIFMDCRQQFCDEVNRLTGGNMTVTYNVDKMVMDNVGMTAGEFYGGDPEKELLSS